MLIEAALQIAGQMLLEKVIRDVAVPTVKRLAASPAAAGTAPMQVVGPSVAGQQPTRYPRLRTVSPVQIVSATPGRVRLEVSGLREQPLLAQAVTDAALGLAGVRQAEASSRTGRLLVHFQPGEVAADAIVAAVERARAAQLGHIQRAAGVRTRRHLAAVV